MPQAIGDPDEMMRFADNLQKFTTELDSRMAQLNSQFNSLGQTWRDQEHRKFGEDFQRAVKDLQTFKREADAHVPFLRRKASALREYLNKR